MNVVATFTGQQSRSESVYVRGGPGQVVVAPWVSTNALQLSRSVGSGGDGGRLELRSVDHVLRFGSAAAARCARTHAGAHASKVDICKVCPGQCIDPIVLVATTFAHMLQVTASSTSLYRGQRHLLLI